MDAIEHGEARRRFVLPSRCSSREAIPGQTHRRVPLAGRESVEVGLGDLRLGGLALATFSASLRAWLAAFSASATSPLRLEATRYSATPIPTTATTSTPTTARRVVFIVPT
jgi:hypothetical protein